MNPACPSDLRLCRADYHNPVHAAALVQLLDAYAQDPAGGGEALSEFAKANLARELAARPQAFSVLAFAGDEAVGLVNCIEGFSTFACRPLVNIHDVAVLASHRGQRIAEQMLVLVDQLARQRGHQIGLGEITERLSTTRWVLGISVQQAQQGAGMGCVLVIGLADAQIEEVGRAGSAHASWLS